MKSNKFTKGLRVIPNTRSKKGGYIVDGYLTEKDGNGKPIRVRKTFSGPNSKLEAEAFLHQRSVLDRNGAASREVRVSKIDDELEYGVLDLVKRLRFHLEDDESDSIDLLRRAVEFYVTSPTRGAKSITVNQARKEYECRDNYQQTSELHQKGWKNDLNKFCEVYGERQISTITIEEVRAWIDRGDRSRTRKRLDRAHIHALFSWAKKQTYLKVNVVTAYELPKLDHKEAVSLSIEQAHNLFYIATKVKGQSLVPYFALAIFAGLRPFEIRRAQWEDIDWDEGIIRARQRKGGGFTRSVDLPEICLEWLEHVKGRKQKGQVVPDNYTKNFNVIRGAAGFRVSKGSIKSCNWWGLDDKLKNCDDKDRPEWVNDICRHTAITYRLKIIKHIGEVAEWAGNSPDIINRNYRSVKDVTKKSTDAFYDLTPKKVIKKGLI